MIIPCAMYKRGSFVGQIDHPGWLSKVVRTEAAYTDAVADGWSPVTADPVVAPAPTDIFEHPTTPAPDAAESLDHGWPASSRRGRPRKVAD